MRLMRVGATGAERPIVALRDGRHLDLSELTDDIDAAFLSTAGLSRAREAIASDTLPEIDISGLRVAAPIARPGAVLRIGMNYAAHEPRGCPRGASFSWYTYSPARVRYPYVRGPLLSMWREARQRLGDPVQAWAEITADPERTARYKSARGKGWFVRSTWDEVSELIAAAHVHTVKAYGPDRVVGFSPIPAMSQVSYSAGTRFLSMIGATILSFYDWYADMPIASPQVFGDQTDMPESGDWWNSSYLMIWGTNLPITRTPDAHFMTEARYRGQKVVVVSPDFIRTSPKVRMAAGLLIRGRLERNGDVINVVAARIEQLNLGVRTKSRDFR